MYWFVRRSLTEDLTPAASTIDSSLESPIILKSRYKAPTPFAVVANSITPFATLAPSVKPSAPAIADFA